MRFIAVLMPGGPQPQPTPTGDTWHAPLGDYLTVGVLLLVFGPPMFVCFWLGCGELYDWWQRRGWRAKQNRRPLK